MRAVRHWVVALVVLAGVVFVGCGTHTDAEPAAAPAPGPDLALLGHGSLEGQDVVLWFWAGY